MTLAGYLTDIARGRPINYERFLSGLPSDIAARHAEYFNIKKVGVQRWQVRCDEPGLFEKLQLLALPPKDRVAAAIQGDSHQAATEAAILLVYHAALADIRPGLVYLSPHSKVQDFDAKPAVLLVENQQNFLQSTDMLQIASVFCGRRLALDNTDVVYGGGTRINSRAVTDWLDQYKVVICAFDFDLGGLRMYRALQKRLGERAVFLQPSDWTPFLGYFVHPPRTTERFLQAISLATRLGFATLADVMLKTGHFMEQESLLAQPLLNEQS